MKIIIRIIAISVASIILPGCAWYQQHEENVAMEDVNKNWDLTIRASHIYPIYPLTEDLQPGDIFWVSKRINDNSDWSQSGYLQLDRLIYRIPIDGYAKFYSDSFDYSGKKIPMSFIDSSTWSNAPGAAFPSYSFTIQQGGGANVSLPIQGIPVGLGLMGAASASGQVTISQAHTYGIDEITLRGLVDTFAKDHIPELRRLLRADGDGTNYLQVVTRVFATRSVAVSMNKNSGYGFTASGGAPKDVPIPILTGTNAAADYTSLVNAVNSVVATNQTLFAAAAGLAPGGTLKFTSVSASSVSLIEQFDRPLVIGYLGFNLQISENALNDLAKDIPLPMIQRGNVLNYQQSD